MVDLATWLKLSTHRHTEKCRSVARDLTQPISRGRSQNQIESCSPKPYVNRGIELTKDMQKLTLRSSKPGSAPLICTFIISFVVEKFDIFCLTRAQSPMQAFIEIATIAFRLLSEYGGRVSR